jgi:hypothetical protein
MIQIKPISESVFNTQKSQKGSKNSNVWNNEFKTYMLNFIKDNPNTIHEIPLSEFKGFYSGDSKKSLSFITKTFLISLLKTSGNKKAMSGYVSSFKRDNTEYIQFKIA